MALTYESRMKLLGEILWLWSNTHERKGWTVDVMVRTAIPAIELEQFFIARDSRGFPTAYISWAFLSLEAEVDYLADPTSIPFDRWKSGDRIWFVDMVSPFGRGHTDELFIHLRERFPAEVARWIRIDPDQKNSKICETIFPGLDPALGKHRLQTLKDEVMAKLQDHPHIKLSRHGIPPVSGPGARH